MRQHLAQIGDIGRSFVRRQIGPGDAFGLGGDVNMADGRRGGSDGWERHQPGGRSAGSGRVGKLRGDDHIAGARDGAGEHGVIGFAGTIVLARQNITYRASNVIILLTWR